MIGACQEPDAPSVFPDDWGTGRRGRAKRSQALAICRTCPARIACGRQALLEVEAGLPLYGIRCGVAFTDIDRQDAKIARLRILVGSDDPCDGKSPGGTMLTHPPLTLTGATT